MASYLAHLNFLTALGDAITAVMTVNVLKRHVPGVPHPTAGLHCTVGCVTGQSVGTVIAHGNEMRDFHVVLIVERPRRVTNHLAQHGGLCVKLNQWKLNCLIR
jgi:hypothetical protein